MKTIIKSTFKLAALLSIVGLLYSCTDPISISPENGTSQICVDAWLYNNLDTQTVYLTRTSTVFSEGLNPGISGAVVKITDDKGGSWNLTESKSGVYKAAFRPVIGNTYKLEFTVGSYNYYATTYLPRSPKIDSLTFEKKEKSVNRTEGYEINLAGRDVRGLGDNYRFKLWHYGLPRKDSIKATDNLNVINDYDINWDGLKFIPPVQFPLNTQRYDATRDRVATKEQPAYHGPDSLKIWVMTMDKPAYQFLSGADDERNNGGLFARPSANVPTNIKGGGTEVKDKAVGFFGAYGVVEVRAVTPINVYYP